MKIADFQARMELLYGERSNRLNIIESIAGGTQRLVVAGGWAHSAALLAAVATGHHATIEELPPP
ncbi:MAG: hypothetical protein M3387_14560 [Actinomycetota bacterium]|nr:hypothetical protein [Actinomycetota bacterium]